MQLYLLEGRRRETTVKHICFQISDGMWFTQSAAQLLQEEVLLLKSFVYGHAPALFSGNHIYTVLHSYDVSEP